MASSAPLIDIFVTHLAEEGPLLKVWGQIDRTAATFVERLIIQYKDHFDRGAGICHPESLTVGQICCAKFGEQGYFRAKVVDTSMVPQGFVRVTFLDYGNTDHVSISHVRALPVIPTNPLVSVDSQAAPFYLAGCVAPRGNWSKEAMTYLKENVCYSELKGLVVGHVAGKRLITLFLDGRDLGEHLTEKSFAVRVPLNVQQTLLQGTYSTPMPSSIPVHPPPGMPVIDSNVNFISRNTSQPQETMGISAPVLAVGSEHTVFIAHIEDGPNLFAVHLKATEKIMQSMIETLNNLPVKPLVQPPIPGTVCLGRVRGQNEQLLLLRAVVVNVLETECQLYFLDFGNTSTVPVNRIYELPQQFFNTKSMALRFCLAGLKDLKVDSEVKKMFQRLVNNRVLTLHVVEPEGPPLKQYGILYREGESILKLLKDSIRQREEMVNFPAVPLPAPGRLVEVSVSYVESVMHFFIQYESRAAALKSVMDLVGKYASNASMVTREELFPGKPVCALFPSDEQWYRARVLTFEGNDVIVLYVDYGNTEKISLMSLRRIDSTLVQIQTQAVLCCLHGFQDSQVNEEQSNRFEELVIDRPLTMKIVGTLPSGKLVVDLFDMSQAPPVSIATQVMAPPPPPPVVATYPQVDEWRPAEKPADTIPKYGREQRFVWKKEPKQKKGQGPRPILGKYGKHEDEGGDTFKKQNESWGPKRDNQEGADKPRRWNRDDGDRKWGGGADREDGEKPWRNRDNRGQGEHDGEKPWRGREDRSDGGRKPWQNRDDKDDEGGRKPWQKREDRGDNEGSRKPWQNRDDKDDEGGRKPWQKREDRGDNDVRKPWQNREDRGDDGARKPWQKREDRGDNESRKPWQNREDREDKPWRNREGGDSQAKPWRKREQNEDDDKGFQERRFKPRDDGNRRFGDGDGERRKFEARDRGERKPWNDGGRKKWEDKSSTSTFTGTAAAEEEWGDDSAVTKQPSGKVYAPGTFRVGAKKKVILVTADDPKNFVVQLEDEATALTEMMDKIKTMYEAGGEVVTDHQVNTPCIARYAEDNTWYRALIKGPENNGTVEVEFVDYGNIDAVATSEIRQIAQQFLNTPVYGIHCSLFGVSGTEWSEEQVGQFLELADGKSLEAHAVGKQGANFEVILHDTEIPSESINEKFGASKESFEAAITRAQAVQPAATISSVIEYASPTDSFSAPNILPETQETVFVSWFVDPGQFFCQLSSSKEEFTKMVNEIQKAYKGKRKVNDIPAVGCPVIARFPSDKVLYRAVVTEVGLRVKVMYIDYGNIETVSDKDLFLIEKRFMTLPGQAVLCTLNGIAPPADEWSKDSPEYDKLFGAERLQCSFHGINEDGKQCVSLLLGEKNIADELVACGLAVKKSDTLVTDDPLSYDLLQGQQISAHVVYIESYTKFFVHLTPSLAGEIQAQVAEYGANLTEMSPFPEADLVEQTLCLASPEEGVWYRARLQAPISSESVGVQFIDFGDTSEIPVSKIQPIPGALAVYRDQATECFVVGSDKQDIIPDIDETFRTEVLEQEIILTVESIENNRLAVHLFDIEGQRLELLKPVDTLLTNDVEPLCPMPVLTKTVSMWVSHVDSADSIWLQKVSEEATLKGLLELMQDFYEAKQQGVALGDPQEGQLCAGKSAADGQWYRARIVVKAEDGQMCVRYLDYGNAEMVPVESLKELDPSFSHLTAFALGASLTVVAKDADACVEEITALIDDATFDVNFLKFEEGKWLVIVENDSVEIAQHLINKDLASHLEGCEFVCGQVSLPSEGQCEVFVSHCEDSSEIWVQRVADSAELYNLQDALIKSAPSQAVLQNCNVGEMCIALFHDDSWYRAKISETDGTTAKVLFVDYGNTYEVNTASVKKLPKKLYKYPRFATKCCIKNDILVDNSELLERLKYQLSDPEKTFMLEVIEAGTLPVIKLLLDGTDVVEVAENTPVPEEAVEVVEQPAAAAEAATPMETVIISYLNSPNEFWIQKNASGEILDTIGEQIASAESFDPIEVSEGMLCAAIYPDDGMWYRAKVTPVGDEIHAYFIDFGNSSPVTELRKLPDDLASHPPMAYCCSLVPPEGLDKWPEDASAGFSEIYGDGLREFELKIVKEGDPLIVSMNVDGVNVENELVKNIKIDQNEVLTVEEKTARVTVAAVESSSVPVDLVSITNIHSPTEFWVQRSNQSSLLDSIASTLEGAENFDPVQDISEGLLCAAKFPDDDSWYRATLTSVGEVMEAYFIDYGNSSPVTEIRNLPADLIALAPLAIRCSFDLPQSLDSWPEEAENEFVNIFDDGSKEFELTVLKEGDPLIVSLKHGGIMVDKELLKTTNIETSGKEEENQDAVSGKSVDVEILCEVEVDVNESSVFQAYDSVSPVLLTQSEVSSEEKTLDDGEKKIEVDGAVQGEGDSPAGAAQAVVDSLINGAVGLGGDVESGEPAEDVNAVEVQVVDSAVDLGNNVESAEASEDVTAIEVLDVGNPERAAVEGPVENITLSADGALGRFPAAIADSADSEGFVDPTLDGHVTPEENIDSPFKAISVLDRVIEAAADVDDAFEEETEETQKSDLEGRKGDEEIFYVKDEENFETLTCSPKEDAAKTEDMEDSLKKVEEEIPVVDGEEVEEEIPVVDGEEVEEEIPVVDGEEVEEEIPVVDGEEVEEEIPVVDGEEVEEEIPVVDGEEVEEEIPVVDGEEVEEEIPVVDGEEVEEEIPVVDGEEEDLKTESYASDERTVKVEPQLTDVGDGSRALADSDGIIDESKGKEKKLMIVDTGPSGDVPKIGVPEKELCDTSSLELSVEVLQEKFVSDTVTVAGTQGFPSGDVLETAKDGTIPKVTPEVESVHDKEEEQTADAENSESIYIPNTEEIKSNIRLSEKLVRDFDVSMTIPPKDEISKSPRDRLSPATFSPRKISHAETIVPGCISLCSPLKMSHSEKIVPGCISLGSPLKVEADEIKPAADSIILKNVDVPEEEEILVVEQSLSDELTEISALAMIDKGREESATKNDVPENLEKSHSTEIGAVVDAGKKRDVADSLDISDGKEFHSTNQVESDLGCHIDSEIELTDEHYESFKSSLESPLRNKGNAFLAETDSEGTDKTQKLRGDLCEEAEKVQIGEKHSSELDGIEPKNI